MLLLRVYEQWRGISFLGDQFIVVARGRKLCVLILVYLVLASVGSCHFDLVCGRQLYFWYCLEGVIGCHNLAR